MKKLNLDGLNFYPKISEDNCLREDHEYRYYFASKFCIGKSVIDIACGPGYGSEILLSNGASRYTGIDIDESNVEYAKLNYAHKDATFIKEDAINFKSTKQFEVACSFETIEHVNNPLQLLASLNRQLQLGGLLFLSTPYRYTFTNTGTIYDKPRNIHHIREFMPSEICSLLNKAGFKNIHMFGQRLSLRYHKNIATRIINKLLPPPSQIAPAYPKNYNNYSLRPMPYVKIPKYFIVEAIKVEEYDYV